MTSVEPVIEHIDIARDFSPTPLGRYRKQGRFSGEAFREDHLRPALARADLVRVDLDGATGLSTGFLDEAFAGLVRDGSLTEVEFWRRIQIDAARDPLLIDEIRSYVNRATFQVSAH